MHRFIRWLARRGIRWFYASAEFVGAERIPASGPVLIVATHGNDLPDILLTFMISPRDVLFVANIAAADLPIVRWTYAGLGVIPIARTRDARALKARGEDAAALNARAFVAVTDALRAGHAVAIFPEGNVHDLPHLGPLRTGAARMALDARAAGVDALVIVPVGYQYEEQTTPRSSVVAIVGDSIILRDWEPVDPERAVSELTRLMRERLEAVTRNAPSWEEARERNAVAAAVGAVLACDATVAPTVPAARLRRKSSPLVHSAAIATALQGTVAPEAAGRAARELTVHVTGLGGRAWSAADHATVLRAAGYHAAPEGRPPLVSLILLAPIAVLGWLWHAPLLHVIWAFARRTAPRPVELAARAIVPGLYLVVLWYVTIPMLLWLAGANVWVVLALFVAQPRLGDLAFRWRDDLRRWMLYARAERLPQAERETIRAAADRVREAWAPESVQTVRS